MGTPHKHAELIKAWADGAEIQSRITYGTWQDCIPAWSSHPDIEYRIKPKTIRYRLALIKGSFKYWVASATDDKEAYFVENREDFIHWLNDWQEVEI